VPICASSVGPTVVVGARVRCAGVERRSAELARPGRRLPSDIRYARSGRAAEARIGSSEQLAPELSSAGVRGAPYGAGDDAGRPTRTTRPPPTTAMTRYNSQSGQVKPQNRKSRLASAVSRGGFREHRSACWKQGDTGRKTGNAPRVLVRGRCPVHTGTRSAETRPYPPSGNRPGCDRRTLTERARIALSVSTLRADRWSTRCRDASPARA
jgi:hypothetical protein